MDAHEFRMAGGASSLQLLDALDDDLIRRRITPLAKRIATTADALRARGLSDVQIAHALSGIVLGVVFGDVGHAAPEGAGRRGS